MARHNEVEWDVWKPDIWQAKNGFKVNEYYCRYSIHGDWHFHQCSRKPKVYIENYGFCTQHARMVKRRMEKE